MTLDDVRHPSTETYRVMTNYIEYVVPASYQLIEGFFPLPFLAVERSSRLQISIPSFICKGARTILSTT